MKESVPDIGSKDQYRADSGRAIPPWSDVARWTDPSGGWGCDPARNRPVARLTNKPFPVNSRQETPTSQPQPLPQRKREPIWLERPSGDGGLRGPGPTGEINGGVRPPGQTSDANGGMRGPGSTGDGAGRVAVETNGVSDALPTFLPLNVHLGVPLSQQTGRPRVRVEPRNAKPATRPKRPWSRRLIWITGTAVMLIGLGAMVWLGLRISERSRLLPALPARPAATLPEASLILAADGSELGTLFDERRIWKPLDGMSPVVVEALLAAEDHRFATHHGVDWVRMAGAFWSTMTGDPEGASTIPMQLARNYFPELKQHDLIDRKIEEILLARRISAAMTKDETLEWYLNTVAFGHNSFGIEAAAQRFFSTSSSDLNLSQAALLVGILKGPSRYDPLRNPEAARTRRNTVLQRMFDLELITATQAEEATRSALNLKPQVYDPADSFAPYFLDYVRREAEQWAQRAGYDLRNDGLVIHTSIRPELQRMAEAAVARQTEQLQKILLSDFGAPGSVRNEQFWRRKRGLEEDLIRRTEPYRALRQAGRSDHDALLAVRSDHGFVQEVRKAATQLQGALVVMDPGSGQILAWVGGHDYRTDQFDKVASARRQPGSIFKPILYARALEDGYSPYYLVQDEIRTFTTTVKGEKWTPTNAGGGASGRLLTLEQGLAWSKNTVSAHLISKIGPQDVIDLARDMGITSPMMPVPSLALGTSETTLLEMTSAYATLADMGVHRNITSITTITDREGKLIATFPSEPDRVLSEQTSYTMIRMLQKAVDQGTGGLIRSRFGIRGDLAGKTGTTQNNADGWFIGMHPDAVVGAWVGFNDQRVSFQSDYWGQGGHNALLLVGDFLKQAMKGPGALLEPARFQRPAGYREPVRPVYSAPSADVETAGADTELSAIESPLRLPARQPFLPKRP